MNALAEAATAAEVEWWKLTAPYHAFFMKRDAKKFRCKQMRTRQLITQTRKASRQHIT